MPRVSKKQRPATNRPSPLTVAKARLANQSATAIAVPVLPAAGFLRQATIIGRAGVSPEQAARNARLVAEKRKAGKSCGLPVVPRQAEAGLIPMAPSTWWGGIQKGIYPQPVRLGLRAVGWRVEDIRALIDRIGRTQVQR